MSSNTKSWFSILLWVGIIVAVPVSIFSFIPWGDHTPNLDPPPKINYPSDFQYEIPAPTESATLEEVAPSTESVAAGASPATDERQSIPSSDLIAEVSAEVLRGKLPAENLLVLLTHPKPSVRMETVRAVANAQNMMAQDGHMALLGFFQSLEEDVELAIPALLETLQDDTLNGRRSNTPYLLGQLASTMDVAPHEITSMLTWTSDNHADPQTRIFAMNAIFYADRNAGHSTLWKRMRDPAGIVRLNALQGIALRNVVTLLE